MRVSLTKPIRDHQGVNHSIGEKASARGKPFRRSNEDDTLCLNVVFDSNQTKGLVFISEFREIPEKEEEK